MRILFLLCLLGAGVPGTAAPVVPQMSPASGGGAVVLLAGVFLVMRSRRSK